MVLENVFKVPEFTIGIVHNLSEVNKGESCQVYKYTGKHRFSDPFHTVFVKLDIEISINHI